jgi:hypothetical protein
VTVERAQLGRVGVLQPDVDAEPRRRCTRASSGRIAGSIEGRITGRIDSWIERGHGRRP